MDLNEITTFEQAAEHYRKIYGVNTAPEFKEVTVREAFDALVKNGFEHIRGEWITQNADGTILGGCALGQMGVNLGSAFAGDFGLELQLNKLGNGANLGSDIVSYNDYKRYDYETNEYEYNSWNEVVEYARGLLKSYFDEKLILRVEEFKLPENLNEQLTTPIQ